MYRRLGLLSAATLALMVLPLPASAEVGPENTISVLAGTHVRGFAGDGGLATLAQVSQPRDTAMGPDGSTYVVDTYNDRIRVIHPNGVIDTFAGNGSHTLATDPDVGDGGPATAAHLSWPHDVFVDAAGNVFIADANHNRLREVTPDGIIHTVAGNGQTGATGDGGLATSASLKNPKTVFRQGDDLYTAGLDNKVRVVHLATGIIDLLAGTGVAGYSDGPPTAAQFNSPQRIQVDSVGNVYVADTGNSAIRKIDALTHVVTTVVGSGLATPRGIALEGDNILYIADSNHHQIKKLDITSGAVVTIAGSTQGFSGDGGSAGAATFYQPRGLTVTSSGDLIVADTFNDELRIITQGSTPPPPPPPVPTQELLTNNSVETSGSPYLGKYSFDDTVSWSSDATLAQDGTHSIQMANLTSVASITGLLDTTPVPSVAGTTYTARVWIKGDVGETVAVRLKECPSSGCLTAAAVKVTLPDSAWHQISTPYTSAQGAPLKYSVVAYALAPGLAVYADQFSLTQPVP